MEQVSKQVATLQAFYPPQATSLRVKEEEEDVIEPSKPIKKWSLHFRQRRIVMPGRPRRPAAAAAKAAAPLANRSIRSTDDEPEKLHRTGSDLVVGRDVEKDSTTTTKRRVFDTEAKSVSDGDCESIQSNVDNAAMIISDDDIHSLQDVDFLASEFHDLDRNSFFSMNEDVDSSAATLHQDLQDKRDGEKGDQGNSVNSTSAGPIQKHRPKDGAGGDRDAQNTSVGIHQSRGRQVSARQGGDFVSDDLVHLPIAPVAPGDHRVDVVVNMEVEQTNGR